MGLVPMLLGRAESGDASGISMGLLLFWLASLAAIGVLAFVPMRLARRGRWHEWINVGTLLWAVLAAWNAIGYSQAYAAWSKEQMLRVQTGYFDPNSTSGAPVWPWGWWIGLALMYVAILGWSFIGRSKLSVGR
jgi:hypothetical protein